MSGHEYDSYDEVLEILRPYDSISNHGPMGAEALCALGRGVEAKAWTESYLKRSSFLKERVASTRRIQGKDRVSALGRYDRFSDWVRYFSERLEEMPWPELLDLWVMKLAPGFSAVALHGPIRTCHAVRALAERDTPLRREELARGLAHWAAGFQRLPTSEVKIRTMPSEAIQQIRPIPPEGRTAPASLVQALKELDTFSVIEALAPAEVTESGDAFLSDLTATLSKASLEHEGDFLSTLGFVHSITGPSSLRMIAPYVSQVTLNEALGYAWQAAAGMYLRFGQENQQKKFEAEAADAERLIDEAVFSGDEHAIKFTEACLRENALHPSGVYLAAANRAVIFLAMRRSSLEEDCP